MPSGQVCGESHLLYGAAVDAGPGPPVDGRAQRMAQGTTAVLLLAGFVFGIPWLVGVVALVSCAGAILGPSRQPFVFGYTALFASRPPARADEDPLAVRAQDILLAVVLVAATLALVLGVGIVGWTLALIAALVAAIAAATGLLLAVSLRDRLRRD